jgi:hypothetical protein
MVTAAAHGEQAGGPKNDTTPRPGAHQQVEPDAVGDGDAESHGRQLAAAARAEPDQDEQAYAAAAAAAEEQEMQRRVEEWWEKNQFGILWEAVTIINLLACYKKPDGDKLKEHLVFHDLCTATSIVKGALFGYFGLSSAIVFSRMISTSRARALLWYLWCVGCITCEVQFDWETHVRTYCTDPEFPLLCFPLAVCPFSLVTSAVGYGATSMILFPLRAIHHYGQGNDDERSAFRLLAASFFLYLAADVALYCYCLRVVEVDATALIASHTLRTVNGVGRGVRLLLLTALFYFLARRSVLRAMRVAARFVRRRRWTRIWRGFRPHAHIE